MKAKEVLNILKITRPTLTKYVKIGRIRTIELPNGFYEYNDDDVFATAKVAQTRKCAVYARVSTNKQKKDLENQVTLLTEYAIKNGYTVECVYKDIASGLNFDRGDFQNMIKEIINYNIKTVIVANRDRLTHVSFDMWKQLFKEFSCNLIVANESDMQDENGEKEIFEDIISLLNCFAMKMYSGRRKKKITLIKEDLENETCV